MTPTAENPLSDK